MNSKSFKTIMGVLGMLLVTAFSIDVSLALEMEMERKDLKPLQSGEIQHLGKKGGGGTPAPPADPHCTNGSVGPVTHSTITRACKVNGQDGVKTCSHKWVKCLGGPGEAEYATSENCGPCVPLATGAGQVQTPDGR